MSKDTNPATVMSASNSRRSTPPDLLKHQKSFELRYRPIIHRQILETSINKEALQRQINAFLPPVGDGLGVTHSVGGSAPSAIKGGNAEDDESVEKIKGDGGQTLA